MDEDIQALISLNQGINDAENRGDREWLSANLAPKLAFERANKTVDDQPSFLEKVEPAKSGQERELRRLGPIHLHGNRAVVECVIGVGGKDFHNLRLFVKREGGWKLLAWANEAV